MPDPTTKTELITVMQNGHTAFARLLEQLSESQMTEPGVSDDWSIKDILAHIATWQGRVASTLEAIQAGNETYQFDPPIKTDEDVNRFNASIFLLNRERSLHEIQQEFRTTYQSIYASTQALSEEDLFNAQKVPWLGGQPAWQNIAGNTFEHYLEHIPAIEAWIQHA